MNYETRESAMKFAIELASHDFLGGWSTENIITTAKKFESYLEGTWGEPGGSEEDSDTFELPVRSYGTQFKEELDGEEPLYPKENVKSRGDRIREALEENDGIEIYTVTVPGGVCGFTNLGEWLRNINTTQENDED